jgi:hypothetical protein
VVLAYVKVTLGTEKRAEQP